MCSRPEVRRVSKETRDRRVRPDSKVRKEQQEPPAQRALPVPPGLKEPPVRKVPRVSRVPKARWARSDRQPSLPVVATPRERPTSPVGQGADREVPELIHDPPVNSPYFIAAP
jgi:hypothetical protein